MLLSSIPTPRQKCVPPRDRSHGRKWHRCSHLEKTSLLRRSDPRMWVSLGHARARTKDYTTSVFGFPCGIPDGCSDDLPLHDVKDFAVSRLTPRTGTEYFIKRTIRLLSQFRQRPRRIQHLKNGGARRDRTDDLLLAKQALSQLSYGPGRRELARRESRRE